MRTGKLPSTVDAQCGTVNHDQGQGQGRLNADGSPCGHNATRFVSDGSVEVLVCGRHEERARERISEVI